ncbi:MAG: SAM-dependent methyltransferase, partial [Lachnospiraceae bacterium]|nr:SAM-dependent methyltransferase [Lachnospiraceae bacterium]
MSANYLYGNWAEGEEENFTKDQKIRHFEEQLFTGYDITEFEALFNEKPVEHLATAGVDWVLEAIQKRDDFSFSDEDFEKFKKWYLAFAENREMLGATNHLLYICKRK